jgi:nucleotide-binding universal stress UspA family protein
MIETWTNLGGRPEIPQIKKILFATDLGKNAYHAFLYAFYLAQEHKAKIVILHAIEPLPHFAVGFKDFEEMVKHNRQERDIKEIKKRLHVFCEKVGTQMDTLCSDFLSNILVPTGYPVEEILNTAEEEGCDVIILGSHGKGFLKQTFLGSVSRGVLERSRKPVFIIPLPYEKGSDWIEI